MKKKLYFTSDWHIGHKNVMKFDNRPFTSLDHMHDMLVLNFNKLVPKHGVTYFLGDMGLCSHGLLKDIVSKLNGTKVLVRGNHDGKMYSMYEAGFDVVTEKAQISIGRDIVTMTHCPLKGVFREDVTSMSGYVPDNHENWHGKKRHKNQYSIENFGQFHLHGHIHSPNGGKSTKIAGRQFDVGVPANNYKPVRLEEIQSWITLTKKKENEL